MTFAEATVSFASPVLTYSSGPDQANDMRKSVSNMQLSDTDLSMICDITLLNKNRRKSSSKVSDGLCNRSTL